MNEDQQYHVRRQLEAHIGEEPNQTIEMVVDQAARLAANELGLDAPPVQADRNKSERISSFQASLLVPIFLLYSAETWTREVRMRNFERLISVPSAVFRNLNKNQMDRQLKQFKLKLDLRKQFGARFYRLSAELQEKDDKNRALKIMSKTFMDFGDSPYHGCPNALYSFLGRCHSEVIRLADVEGGEDQSCLTDNDIERLKNYDLFHRTVLVKEYTSLWQKAKEMEMGERRLMAESLGLSVSDLENELLQWRKKFTSDATSDPFRKLYDLSFLKEMVTDARKEEMYLPVHEEGLPEGAETALRPPYAQHVIENEDKRSLKVFIFKILEWWSYAFYASEMSLTSCTQGLSEGDEDEGADDDEDEQGNACSMQSKHLELLDAKAINIIIYHVAGCSLRAALGLSFNNLLGKQELTYINQCLLMELSFRSHGEAVANGMPDAFHSQIDNKERLLALRPVVFEPLVEIEYQFLQPMLNDYALIVAWNVDFRRIVENQIKSSEPYTKIFNALFTVLENCELRAPSLKNLVNVNSNEAGSKETTVKTYMASKMMDKFMENYLNTAFKDSVLLCIKKRWKNNDFSSNNIAFRVKVQLTTSGDYD